MKKMLSVILTVFVLYTANICVFAFSDVSENHAWATDAINYLYDNKFIEGYPDGTFKPDKNITNAEMAKLITLVFGESGNEGTYNDVKADNWYYSYVKNSKDYFIRETEFFPDEFSKRKEVAYAIYIASGMNLNDSEYSEELSSDKKYELTVNTMNKKGIIEGYSDGTLKPDNNVTRAEFAVMIKRIKDIDTEEQPAETPEEDASKKHTAHNYFFLVTEISQALNEDGDVCRKVCGYNNGEYEELYITDDVKYVANIKPYQNSIFYVFKDYYGNPTDIMVYGGIASLGDNGNLNYRKFNGKNSVVYGEVTRLNNGKSVELTEKSQTGTGVILSETYRLTDDTHYYIYKDGEISESSQGKIRDQNYSKDADYLLCHIEDGVVKTALIIRKN